MRTSPAAATHPPPDKPLSRRNTGLYDERQKPVEPVRYRKFEDAADQLIDIVAGILAAAVWGKGDKVRYRDCYDIFIVGISASLCSNNSLLLHHHNGSWP
jgi:hypothetical protein